MPTPDQVAAIRAAASLASIEQDKVPGSIQALKLWTASGCSGGRPPIQTTPTTTSTVPTTEATTTEAAPSGGQAAASKEADCDAIGDVVSDLDFTSGFDYVRDRDFLRDYADRAPEEIRDHVRRLRDFFDQFAAAAQAAGIEPGKDPLPDQADKLNAALHFSNGEQKDLQRSLETLATWRRNEC